MRKFQNSLFFSAGQVHKRPGCGITDSVRNWMETVQRSAESDDVTETKQEGAESTEKLPDPPKSLPLIDPGPTYKYSAEANIDTGNKYKREKRALPSTRGNRKTCHIYIQTDPLFWRHIYKQVRIIAECKLTKNVGRN